jgi:uncharacterized protein
LIRSPKLYFYDVGLAAYLLGIQTDAHVATHPLRGALFENLVVAEVLKWYWHRGRRAGLHFYRDSDFFRGLRSFARQYREPPPNGGALVYGGQSAQKRDGVTVVPIGGIAGLLRSVAG